MQISIANGGVNSLNNNFLRQQRSQSVNTETGNPFGPQCRVTISREGRKLSAQSKQNESNNMTAARSERLLLRQQEQTKESENESSNLMDEISKVMGSIQNSYEAGEDKETITKKQAALQRLLDLKAQQEEENKQRAEAAANQAAGTSKSQEEIDRKSADLYMMLKSFEEQEEDEEEEAGGSGKEHAGENADNAQSSVGDQFQQSAAMLGASSAKRELQAKGVVEDLADDGYARLAEVDGMMHDIWAEVDMAKEALGQEGLSEDEKNQLMSEHLESARSMYMANYSEMAHLRRSGLQEIRDAGELESKRVELDLLDGVDGTKQTIVEAGVTAVLQEASQGTLDKASEELEERVQEAIDERNDVVSGSEEEVTKEAEETAENQESANEEVYEEEK